MGQADNKLLVHFFYASSEPEVLRERLETGWTVLWDALIECEVSLKSIRNRPSERRLTDSECTLILGTATPLLQALEANELDGAETILSPVTARLSSKVSTAILHLLANREDLEATNGAIRVRYTVQTDNTGELEGIDYDSANLLLSSIVSQPTIANRDIPHLK